MREAADRLARAGVEQPAREARLLLALARGGPNVAWPDFSDPVPPGFAALVARRAAREPMARLRGRQGFWTIELILSAETLIPRPDTETVIDAALAAQADRKAVRGILDLGTGSGALLLAALSEFPDAWGLGTDVSPGACEMAAANAAANGLADRAAFVCGEWATCLDGGFDLILSNPPYIPSRDIAGLMPEVARHEPARALDGGPDGLAAYRALIPELPRLLRPRGVIVMEHGEGQSADVARLLRGAGFAAIGTRSDLAGIARVAIAQKPVGATR